MRRAILLLSAFAFAAPSVTAAAQTAPAQTKAIKAEIAAAVASPLRDKDKARDQYRRPAETLEFFQVAPDMKVGEYAPGGEWYSRLLGLYLGPKGKLVGLYFDPTSGAFSEAAQKGIRDGAAKYPADVAAASGLPAERFSAMTLEKLPDAEKGTFDRILVMRMMHNLLRWNIADREIKAMRELLKPGGMIGIEQHRAKPDAPYSYTDGSKGYLREADVIKFMEVNGFTYVGKSEANANKKDPANWEGGVWTLPPMLRGAKEEDKARLQAIGESDRMTLLFRKRP
ncbi:class I SAM-dependent methyltransferase [Novosphingobium ginsenosidimutans]|uniref:Class I SAM-dependent methyltransferase n=1 Tax=Novosphingobium ginsenosidimutans TaxID=1176536 RepID=A0A5B8S1H3_9SPHN|nr:class I SAM-dependent methyltransferase [Novosphingobium ginsenosidimutans]QEA15301.1 class I SAM-dependent methyltransferase [Novosphingobium ginsenosidimutans]